MSIRPARAFVIVLCLTLAAVASAQNGRLEPGDAQLGSGGYYDMQEHEGRGGERLTVTLRSSDFDPYLAVIDPAGTVLLEVDDSDGQGLDVVETVVLPVDGTYRIVVTSALPGETGAYLLTLASEFGSGFASPEHPGATFPSAAPEPNVVQGVVVAERTGAPIAGARITVAGYDGNGASVVEEATTDAQGRYRLPMVAGLYSVRAEVEMPFGEETFHLTLHPASGRCDQAMSERGIVADFVLRLAGYQSCFEGDPTNYHNYYGGTISVDPADTATLPADAVVTFTFEPLGALIDGAAGDTLIVTRTVAMLEATSGPLDQTRHLHDIAIGAYRLSAVARLPGGAMRQLYLAPSRYDAPATAVDVGFAAVRMFPYGIRVTGVALFDAP